MKRVAVSSAIGGILLALLLLLVWPWPFPEQSVETGRVMRLGLWRPVKTTAEIDPPFGFAWGDSMARVEALLGYSGARIASREIEASNEYWNVEGLVQSGLKDTRFLFRNNSLSEVELQCQFDAWPGEQYKNRVEELRAFFDAKYRGGRPSVPIVREGSGRDRQFGYGWRFRESSLKIFWRAVANAGGLFVNNLVIHYRGNGASTEPDWQDADAKRWQDEILSPLLASKLSAATNAIPAESALGITESKLLNTSETDQTAYALSIAVKLRANTEIDSTEAEVQVNFYDATSDRQLVLTDAEVNYDWRSHRDWKEANPETLTVSYIRRRSPNERASRKLFGYTTAVYYQGKLESVRADPAKLLNLFPVRTFISPFERAQEAAGRGDFAAAARLYQRSADEGNLFALENLAWFYARGRGVERDYNKAGLFYERAALQNSPRALNALAWFLATCPDDAFRNGKEAIGHATKACELVYWAEWKYIDTLATAWAETGDFKRAVAYEELAMGTAGSDDEANQKMRTRLALYQERQPFRE